MRFSRHLITAPTAAVVTLAEVKEQLRIDDSDLSEDRLLDAILTASVNQLDAASGGWLGRALREQTWELRLDRFPADEITLPFPPFLAITSFKYDDTAGTERTLAVTTGYRLFSEGTMGRAVLRPLYSASWPIARSDLQSVRIRYTCGYAVAAGAVADQMPQPIKQAVLLMVKELYSLGERNLMLGTETIDGVGSWQYVVSENAAKVIRAASENLLSAYRVWG